MEDFAVATAVVVARTSEGTDAEGATAVAATAKPEPKGDITAVRAGNNPLRRKDSKVVSAVAAVGDSQA